MVKLQRCSFVCLLGILNPDALRVDDENCASLTIRRIFFRKHGVAEENYTTIPEKQIAVNFHELETSKTIQTNPVTSKKCYGFLCFSKVDMDGFPG